MLTAAFVIPKYQNIWEPIGVGNIITYCNQNYSNSNYMKVYNYNLEEEHLSDLLDYNIVAFSCTTPTYPECLRIAKQLKIHKPEIITVIGGWHATATPYSISTVFDHVVSGEGEVAFLEILRGDRHRYIFAKPVAETVWTNRVAINQEKMLDKCESICNERIASFQSRKGCSHSCAFCSEKLMSENNIRVRDSENVLDEIEYVTSKYKVDSIKFVDPTWAYPIGSVKDFCEKKIQRGNTIPFEATAHISYMDKEILELIYEAGCNQLNFGVESGSQKILNDMHKGITVQKTKTVFSWAKEIGIQRRAFFLLGMPNDTKETIEETRQLIYDIEPDVFGITILCPYPGSEFWRPEFEGTNFGTMDEYTNDVWYTENFTNQELKDIQSEFNEEFNHVLVAHKRDTSCQKKD